MSSERETRNTNMADSLNTSAHPLHDFRNLCVRRWRNRFLRKTVGIPLWAFWNICILLTMSDHSVPLPPAVKHRLRWSPHRQKWKLIVKLTLPPPALPPPALPPPAPPEPARDLIPEWDGQANALERFQEDVLIFTHAVPKERRVTIGPKLLQQFPNGSPQRAIGLERLKSDVLQLEDGANQLLKLIQLRLGKDLQQDVSEHYKTFFFTALHVCFNSLCNTTVAEESNLHERALQAVRPVSAPSEGETETKEIIADVLRGFLLLVNAALTGSEQVFVFGVARKSYTYSHTANAFRETWSNDELVAENSSTYWTS